MINKQNSIQTWLMCLVISAFMVHMLTGLPDTVQAQEAKTVSLTDPKEFEAFLDPIFAEQMELEFWNDIKTENQNENDY